MVRLYGGWGGSFFVCHALRISHWGSFDILKAWGPHRHGVWCLVARATERSRDQGSEFYSSYRNVETLLNRLDTGFALSLLELLPCSLQIPASDVDFDMQLLLESDILSIR
jgi:hypothetical protein